MDDVTENTTVTSSLSISPERLDEIKKLLSGTGGSAPDGLSSLLSNPDLAAKLPQIMETIKPMLTLSKPETAPKELSKEEERDRLLLSLRPFLSKERQDLMESILKLSKLTEALNHLS